MFERNRMTRRDLLRTAALGAGVAAVPALGRAASAADSEYGPFKMGLQSYSLRGYQPIDAALAQTKVLGLHYWEAYAAHVPLTTDPAQVKEILDKLKAADVKVLAHGVTRFTSDAAANRKVFEAAKALGIQTISADPDPNSFDSLDMLVQEFKINIGIHNHGPGHRYDKLQQVVDALKDRHPRVGACADLGHFLRSGEESVQVIETLGKRVHGVHLKDVKNKTQFTILGKGDMDLVGVLRALKKLKYNQVLALEYEENPSNPIAEIQECLAAVRSAVQKI
jgi:sugar phosphate isomerase/epimerase